MRYILVHISLLKFEKNEEISYLNLSTRCDRINRRRVFLLYTNNFDLSSRYFKEIIDGKHIISNDAREVIVVNYSILIERICF